LFQQKSQYLEGLVLQFESDAVFVEFPGSQIYFEGSEADSASSSIGFHSLLPAVGESALRMPERNRWRKSLRQSAS
jgi:hypothetical protein